MLKSVRVPAAFEKPFVHAEELVERRFQNFVRAPARGTVHIGGERYVLMRAESLHVAWFEALKESFGEEAAREFIYNTAREIGRADSKSFSTALHLTDSIDRLASGPVHFAHAGWALVDILGDSKPARDDSYFLHYVHPNTFEAEVLKRRGTKVTQCACLFSAGYSAGWCSDAFELSVQGRELRCVAMGHAHCEFIMAPASRLDQHEEAVRASWQ